VEYALENDGKHRRGGTARLDNERLEFGGLKNDGLENNGLHKYGHTLPRIYRGNSLSIATKLSNCLPETMF